MPYITKEDRVAPIKIQSNTRAGVAISVGQSLNSGAELNYFITEMVNSYLNQKGLRYSNISDVIGALEGAKLEFVRKVVNPYEEKKEQENGGIYSVS